MGISREEFELGTEPLDVERRQRAGVVVSVRLTAAEADRLSALAQAQRKTVSQVVREAVTEFIEHGSRRSTASGPWTGVVTNNQVSLNLHSATGPSVRTHGSVHPARSQVVSCPG